MVKSNKMRWFKCRKPRFFALSVDLTKPIMTRSKNNTEIVFVSDMCYWFHYLDPSQTFCELCFIIGIFTYLVRDHKLEKGNIHCICNSMWGLCISIDKIMFPIKKKKANARFQAWDMGTKLDVWWILIRWDLI